MLDQLTILAPGLLGGSVARAARERRVARRIVIWARRPEVRKAIAGLPWCDAVADTPEAAVQGASLVLISSHADAIVPLARQIAAHVPKGSLVTDVGSVKSRIARQGHAALRRRAHFVGAHPMAGSHQTGWEHSSAALFVGRTCFITPTPDANERAVAAVGDFWSRLGAEIVTIAPRQHDEIVAHISHLPQVVASSLCAMLATKDPAWRDCAGNGLRDTTRIAGSDPLLWRAILEQNQKPVLRALRRFQKELQVFEQELAKGDWSKLTARLARGKAYRDGFRPLGPP
jgi:cyclohexadieny/prephenate dehydrogenase